MKQEASREPSANRGACQTIEIQDQQRRASVEEKDPHAAGTKLGSYIFGKSLGKGTFGKVKLATHMLTQELVSGARFENLGGHKNTRKGKDQGKERH